MKKYQYACENKEILLKILDIYTDGACSGNPGPGGWAAILIYGESSKEISGGEAMTTNNRMELMAAKSALEALRESCEVNLYSDSAYLVNAFNKGWIASWLKNGWRTSQKQPVENRDLWEALIAQSNTHVIHFLKVKGHSDNILNNRCDELARTEAKRYTER